MEKKRCKGDCRKFLPIESFSRYQPGSYKRRIRCKGCEALYQDEKQKRESIKPKKPREDQRYITDDLIYC